MKLMLSILFFISITGIAISIPVPVFLQPIESNPFCRAQCYDPWSSINAHMMVPMATGVIHPMPRTYIIRLLKTNSTLSIPKISSTTEPLPSCDIPCITSINSTESTIPCGAPEVMLPLQEPTVIKNDTPNSKKGQCDIIQPTSNTESDIYSITNDNNIPISDTTSAFTKQEVVSSKTDYPGEENAQPLTAADSPATQNQNVQQFVPEKNGVKNIDFAMVDVLARGKLDTVRPEDQDIDNQI